MKRQDLLNGMELRGEVAVTTIEPILYAYDYGDRIVEETLPVGTKGCIVGQDDEGFILLTDDGEELGGISPSQVEAQ